MFRALGTTAPWAGILLGTSAMLSVGIMRGAMTQSRDILYERYMQDTRYSRNMLLNASRVGVGMGSRFDQYGSTMGLSNSLSATRHGR
jgi:hypothetical protein